MDAVSPSTARYNGKVALITGGAAGIGKAIARAFCAEGATVLIVDRDEEAAHDAAQELRESGKAAASIGCDVSREHEVDHAVRIAVEEFGRLDICVNNAGLHLSYYNRPFTELPREAVRALLEVNVMGIVNCSVACSQPMRAQKSGVILNVSSIAGYAVATPYGVSKLAVRGLTTAFASELADAGIRVNCVAPGLAATESAMADLPGELVNDMVSQRQLIHRLGSPADVVSTALFLCSDDAAFVTGETLKVSGGYPLVV